MTIGDNTFILFEMGKKVLNSGRVFSLNFEKGVKFIE